MSWQSACICENVCIFRNGMVLFSWVPVCLSELSSKAPFVVTVWVYDGEKDNLKHSVDKLFSNPNYHALLGNKVSLITLIMSLCLGYLIYTKIAHVLAILVCPTKRTIFFPMPRRSTNWNPVGVAKWTRTLLELQGMGVVDNSLLATPVI